ncbi:MAG TPA: hypothetical protein VGQ99_06360 [Tepidisphaeraceae bacterium]|nr:hypothetical protein [Tepidisphaeraceae bacterium]
MLEISARPAGIAAAAGAPTSAATGIASAAEIGAAAKVATGPAREPLAGIIANRRTGKARRIGRRNVTTALIAVTEFVVKPPAGHTAQ